MTLSSVGRATLESVGHAHMSLIACMPAHRRPTFLVARFVQVLCMHSLGLAVMTLRQSSHLSMFVVPYLVVSYLVAPRAMC